MMKSINKIVNYYPSKQVYVSDDGNEYSSVEEYFEKLCETDIVGIDQAQRVDLDITIYYTCKTLYENDITVNIPLRNLIPYTEILEYLGIDHYKVSCVGDINDIMSVPITLCKKHALI